MEVEPSDVSNASENGKIGGGCYSRREFLKIAGIAGAAIGASSGLGAVLAACGGSTTTTSAGAATTTTAAGTATTTTAAGGATTTVSAGSSAISQLPSEYQAYYKGADQLVGPSPLIDFKPKNGPPWLLGYSSPYAGNTWKAGVRTRFAELVPVYQQAGLVKDLITTESNLNTTLQIQQIRQLVDQGCDGILSSSGDSTALNGAIGYAYDHGVPFVMLSGFVTEPHAISVSCNNWLSGALQGEALARMMGGKGDVLEVAGILGSSANKNTDTGIRTAFEAFPDMKIVGVVEGKWTEPVAQAGVLTWLSSHPAPVQGVATQSPGEMGTLQAFMQAGGAIPPFTLGGVLGPAAYWKDHQTWVDVGYNVWPPGGEGQAGWETLIRILQGQGPVIQSILYPPKPFQYAELATLIPAGTKYTDDGWLEPPYRDWVPLNFMNSMFANNPVDPLEWKAS
jgi:ribose transport system substrate-binding protein